MTERVLDVLQCSAQVQGLGGVGVAQAVGRDAGREASGAAETGQLLVRAAIRVAGGAVPCEEQRSAGALLEVGVEASDDRGASATRPALPPLRVTLSTRWPWSWL